MTVHDMEKELTGMGKKNILIYGAGNNFLFSYCDLLRFYNIVAVADGNPEKMGKKFFDFCICDIADVEDRDYDMLVITPMNSAKIRGGLEERGIRDDKIFDLQSVLDMIPDAEWNSGEAVGACSRDQNGSAIAVVFYGGMGDLLVGKQWLNGIMGKYRLAGCCFDLYMDGDLAEDGKMIFRDAVPKENICVIDTDKEGFFSDKRYGVIFRFCIVPEVWYWKRLPGDVVNPEFLSYVDRLDRYGKEQYNRGFFAAGNFYKTVRKLLVERPGVRYHTAYDVFGDFAWAVNSKMVIADAKEEEAFLLKTGLKGKRYITLNTGLNREYLKKGNTRAWPFENWKRLALRLKKDHPNLTLVQVGIRMRREDDIPADIHMNGMTNLEQVSIVLKHALFHVDYDGGLVHVRHMTGGTSIVLMGPSATENHEYPENVYLQAPACSSCEWTTPDWLSVCPKGYESPPCMESITVDMVIERINRLIEKV